MLKLSRTRMTFLVSFLLLLVAFAVFLPSLLNLNQSSVKKAHAASQNNLTWTILASQVGYAVFMRALRNQLSSRIAYGNTAVLPAGYGLVPVTLINGEDQHRITIYIQQNNFYIVGWNATTAQGVNNFFYLNDVRPPIPAGATGHVLPFSSVYSELTGAGGGQRIGSAQGYLNFQASVSALATYPATGATAQQTANVARGLIQLAQGIAEASRFTSIYNSIYANFQRYGAPYQITAEDAELENNWDGMSTALRNALATGARVHETVGNETFSTVQALSAALFFILAVAVNFGGGA